MEVFPLAVPNDPLAQRPDHIVHPNRIKRRMEMLKANPAAAANGPITPPLEVRLPQGRDSMRRAEMDAILARQREMAETSMKEAKDHDLQLAKRRRAVQKILDDKDTTPEARQEAREALSRSEPEMANGAPDALKAAHLEQDQNTRLKRIIAKHTRRERLLRGT